MSTSVYNTTRELLLSTPLPMQTSSYKPVSHGQLMDLTLNGIEKAGFILGKEHYSSLSYIKFNSWSHIYCKHGTKYIKN